ncbi:MAG: hypothetical protein KIT69_02290 [Propionibacteriaceae bacterium]|nr:hypothetical protein [Propionibacteriaceae bacterium]
MRMGLTVCLAALVMATGCSPGPPPPPDPSTPAPPTVAPTLTATPTPSPSESAAPDPDECAFLPAGVDRRACTVPEAGEPPIPPDPEFEDLYILEVPGPIRCDVASGEYPWAACAAGFDVTPVAAGEDCEFGDFDPNFVYLSAETPDQTWLASQGACRGDPLTAEFSEPPTLATDRILVSEQLAVLATADGITVWNGEARHGFAILDGQVLTW